MPASDHRLLTEGLAFGPSAARVLFPLHVVLDSAGRITAVGQTTARVFRQELIGQAFLDVFTVQRPRLATNWDKLRRKTGSKLHLIARPDHGEPVEFRGLAAPFGPAEDGLLIDLSFGPAVSEAITRFDLTRHDFRPDDYAIDIVYTFETQRSLLENSERLTAALKKARDEAEERANLDPVTGIANRRALHAGLEGILAHKDKSRTHALLHLDLDKFKPINDTFGHTTGDEVLVRVSRILTHSGGADATAARIGGDEFALLLPDIPSRGMLDDLIRQLLSAISAPLQIEQQSFRVGVSIGAVTFTGADYETSDLLLQHSDIALYEAKKTGNTYAHLSAAMLQRRQDNANLIRAIEAGLDRKEFVPHYQLQIDAISNRVHGAEVLARWVQQDGSVAAPASFLEAASHAGLMAEIDDAVRTQSIETLAAWRRMGLQLGGLSINLSPANLRSHDFCETFQDEVFAAGLSPQSVRLELLESILFESSDTFLIQQSHQLNKAGFPLVLDDFGTGHASIATLVDIPVSMIKIDRSFVQGIDYIPKKRRIVTSMLAMADSLGIRVMAEGVETRAELSVLKNAGCRYFQGFLFARPLPAQATARLLQEWENSPVSHGSAG